MLRRFVSRSIASTLMRSEITIFGTSFRSTSSTSEVMPTSEEEESSRSRSPGTSSSDEDFRPLKEDPDRKRMEGAQLMRSLNAYTFRDHLRELSDSRMHMRFEELMELAQKQGAAATKEESRALCEALVASGVLFRYRDMVYLSTDDIAEMVLSCLPDTEKEYQKRVEMLEAELRPLQIEKKFIDEQALKKSQRILQFGLCLLICQLLVFVRLTYWELSWDYMEPVSYFISLLYGIIFYAYFLFMNENMEYHHVRDRLWNLFSKEQRSTFDSARYEKLMKELERYRKYLVRYRP